MASLSADQGGSVRGFEPAKAVGNSRWLRLIPIAIIVYIISFMDRTNISFAFAGIGHDLHVTKTQQGLAGGIFFVGYLFLQIPGGHLAEHWSAKKFVGIMILIWGCIAFLTGFVQNFSELLIARFLLGVAEGGIWPAILVLISHWFPSRERARAYGYWIMNIAVAIIITAPLSGWILTFGSWRNLFMIEGIFPIVIAAPLWFAFVKDRPAEAAWCGPAERDYIERQLALEAADAPPSAGYRDVLRSSVVWKLVAVYFFIQIGFYGLDLWLPTLLKRLSHEGIGTVGLLTAIPYVVAIGALYLNGWWSDRDQRPSWHVFASLVLGALALIGSVIVGSSVLVVAILLICIAASGSLAYDGPFWARAVQTMPAAVVGGALGLINAIGNLGGFVGPYLGGYLQHQSGGSFLTTAAVLAVALVVAGLIMLTVKPHPVTSASPQPGPGTVPAQTGQA